jgi:hypothetical protein
MVRSIVTYQHIRNLCHFFNSTSNIFRFIDEETIAVVSGTLSGLVFEFQRDRCCVKTNGYNCFDLPLDFSEENLVRLLVNHNIIRMGDVEVN